MHEQKVQGKRSGGVVGMRNDAEVRSQKLKAITHVPSSPSFSLGPGASNWRVTGGSQGAMGANAAQ